MRKFLTGVLSVFLILTSFVGCNEGENAEHSAVMLSSFESYYDVQKIALQNFTGRVDFESGEGSATEGAGSARVTFLYETETPPQAGAQVSREKVPYIAFRSNVFADGIKRIGDFDTFHIDVFNANDRAIDVFFNIQTEDKSFVAAQQYTLTANQWNYLNFSSFNHFYPLDQNIAEIRLYFVDGEKYTAKNMQLRFDNCYVTEGKKSFEVTAEENEIISFNSANDLNGILNYSRSVPAIFGTSYVNFNTDPADKGSLRVGYGVGFDSIYDITSETQGYYLKLHNRIIERIGNASKLSMKVRNAGQNDAYVGLVVKTEKQNLVSEVLISKGKTETVLLDILPIKDEKITDVSVMIDNWNVMPNGVLYLSSIRKTQ